MRVVCPSKYDEAVEKYVTPKRNVTRRAARQNHNDYNDDDSNDSALPKIVVRKRTSIPVTWNGSTVSSFGQKSM